MSSLIASIERRGITVPGWFGAVAVLVVFAAVGPALSGVVRPAFVLACAAAGWYAWRRSPGAHLQCALVLFAFAPFVRRLIDLSIGFDESGFMLVGPLLAIMIPAASMRGMLEGDRVFGGRMAPLLVIASCIAYASAITLFQGEWMNAASGALKWIAPMLYAATLIDRADRDDVIHSAASAFLFILPVIGLYGILQYVDPPAWDRYWMQSATIMSAGQPIPFGVRTFSTMNGPASFATFVAAGFVLVCFLRPGWQPLVFAGPAAFAFLLSLYRTAWLSLAVGVLFCLLFSATRRRASGLIAGISGAGLIAALLTPFGEVITERFATLGSGSEDASAQERLDQFIHLWNQPDSSLFGIGFKISDVGSAGTMAVDGMLIACWVTMGIVVGMICIAAFVFVAVQAITAAWQDGCSEAIVIGALGCGALAQLPLANISSGELGFLFWTFMALTPRAPAAVQKVRNSMRR